jgi:hypothetical protein
VVVAVAGTDGKREYKNVQLLPATKPIDVLSKLNLEGFQLAKPEGGAFKATDDLYGSVADGQKLFATKSDVEAGARAPGK